MNGYTWANFCLFAYSCLISSKGSEILNSRHSTFLEKNLLGGLDVFTLNGPVIECNDKDFERLVTLLSYESHSLKADRGQESQYDHRLRHIPNCGVISNFSTFHQSCCLLIKAIDSWLSEYGADELNFR